MFVDQGVRFRALLADFMQRCAALR
jgi:hypothetical protein